MTRTAASLSVVYSFKRSGNEDEHLSLQLVGAEVGTSQLFIVSPFNPAFPMNNLPLEMI